VLARLRPSGRALPDFVHTPDWMSNNGSFLPGQDAGFFGTASDPFVAGDPRLPNYRGPGLDLPPELSLDRAGRQRWLLEAIDRTLGDGEAVEGLDAHYRKAYSLISTPEARRAFDLSREPAAVRQRYGLDPDNPRTREARQFGGLPHLGQCLLLARRLIEAGPGPAAARPPAPPRPSGGAHRPPLPPPPPAHPPPFAPRLPPPPADPPA